MRCKTCHYSLLNLTGPPHRCPECGSAFDPNDRTTFEHFTRPTIWHGLLLFFAIFLGLGVAVLVLPSARANLNSAFDTVSEQVWFTLRLMAVISAFVTGIAWIGWYVRWRRYQSSN